MPTKKNNHRPGGRPPKLDKEQWGQITCVLKHETIEKLRNGAGSKHFGEFLQWHLDRYPPPTRDEYLYLTEHKEVWRTIKRRRVPVLFAPAPLWKTDEERKWHLEKQKEERKKARELKRFLRLSAKDQEWERTSGLGFPAERYGF